MPRRLNGDQCTLRKITFKPAKCIEDLPKPDFRQDVFHPQLHDARPIRSRPGKHGAKVEVVGEKHMIMGGTPFKHLPIGRACRPDVLPVNRFQAGGPKLCHPAGRQVHVHEDLHSPASVSSLSSARHAA